MAEIERVAQRPFNILITGETGTGKTYAAREIHRLSARSIKPFLELNCANLPEHLVEAELFGYSKGAFTGADHHHKGLFEEADDGILFLDEIGDISPTVQSKLLRAIDEKEIKRLGTNRYRYCDVQVIAATSRNLATMIETGHFREDLYFRLAVLTIETAPLRAHREDIPALIAFYLREAAGPISASNNDCGSYKIDERAAALLSEYDYLGNIRALRNLIYELTSYINIGDVITEDLVLFTLAKTSNRKQSIRGSSLERQGGTTPQQCFRRRGLRFSLRVDRETGGHYSEALIANGKELQNPNKLVVAATLEKTKTYVFAESVIMNPMLWRLAVGEQTVGPCEMV